MNNHSLLHKYIQSYPYLESAFDRRMLFSTFLTFKIWNKKHWLVNSAHGIQIQINCLRVDTFGDRMVMMEMIIPAGFLKNKQALNIAVTDAKENIKFG